jgi:hypothetical protein
MRIKPGSADHQPAASGNAGLECPRRCGAGQHNGDGRRNKGQCPTCGLPLIVPVRKIEADARQRLYGSASGLPALTGASAEPW